MRVTIVLVATAVNALSFTLYRLIVIILFIFGGGVNKIHRIVSPNSHI
jgi:hypothetical protein